MLDNMLEEAEILKTTAANPVELDRAWILNSFNNQIKQEEFIVEPKYLPAIQGLGTLLALPRELRDLIYGHAITDGTLTLAQASKQTQKEMSPLIFKKGIYRLAIGTKKDYLEPHLSSRLVDRIQNLEIRVNPHGVTKGLAAQLPNLYRSDGAIIQRQICTVIIECNPGPLQDSWAFYTFISNLRGLAGFKRVVFELELSWVEPVHSHFAGGVKMRILNPLMHNSWFLEKTLGTAEFTNTREFFLDPEPRYDAYRMTFYPQRKADESTGRAMKDT